MGAILAAIACVCTVFLVPETTYDRGEHALPIQRNLPRPSHYVPRTTRPPVLSLRNLPSARLTVPTRFQWVDPDPPLTWFRASSSSDLSLHGARAPARVSKNARSTRATAAPAVQYHPFTFVQSLQFGPYKGNVWHQFKKPWLTLQLPATSIIMLQYGGLVGGVAVISTVGPQVLSLPPYEWGQHTGLLFVGALVGIIIGGGCTAVVADQRLKRSAKVQDYGYAEPESRIPVLLPALAIGTGGLLVFGFCAQYPGEYQWVGLEVAYGMVAFALTQVPSVWFSYVSVSH